MNPVGPTFHRSFPLQRSVLSSYLTAIQRLGPDASKEDLRAESGLGTMKIPASIGYSRGVGLLTSSGSFTPLAEVVMQRDLALTSQTTQWLLHAGISGLSAQAPIYWGTVWELLEPGKDLPREELEQSIASAYESGFIGADSAKVSATVFISTYRNPDGLKTLGLLSNVPGGIQSPVTESDPPAAVFAFALVEIWSKLHSDQLATNLDWFLTESRLERIFRISRPKAEALLEEVAGLGLIDLYRAAPPFSIVRRWSDPSDALKHLYADA